VATARDKLLENLYELLGTAEQSRAYYLHQMEVAETWDKYLLVFLVVLAGGGLILAMLAAIYPHLHFIHRLGIFVAALALIISIVVIRFSAAESRQAHARRMVEWNIVQRDLELLEVNALVPGGNSGQDAQGELKHRLELIDRDVSQLERDESEQDKTGKRRIDLSNFESGWDDRKEMQPRGAFLDLSHNLQQAAKMNVRYQQAMVERWNWRDGSVLIALAIAASLGLVLAVVTSIYHHVAACHVGTNLLTGCVLLCSTLVIAWPTAHYESLYEGFRLRWSQLAREATGLHANADQSADSDLPALVPKLRELIVEKWEIIVAEPAPDEALLDWAYKQEGGIAHSNGTPSH
jgi:hypothetical protein